MSLPQPMTTAECDLRGYEFMPLFGTRLFGSEFYAKANDAEFRAAMRLWWAAWQQCPAGSLPDDDAALCRFADLGRDLRTWKRIKANALHGFTLCSDGRLYHKLLCDEAKVAFDRRRRDRERKAKQRAGNATPHDPQPIEIPTNTTEMSVGQDVGQDAEQAWDVTGDRTGQDRTGQESSALHCIDPDSVPTQANDEPHTQEQPEPPVRKHAMPSLDQGEAKLAMYFPHLGYDLDANSIKRVKAGNAEAVNTRYVHAACQKVCRAAKIPIKGYHGDWETVVQWLRAGYHLETEILPAIEQHVAQFGAHYNPPRWLRALTARIVNYRQREAA